ncbi:MAG: uncharacterized protein KVP18_002338 [Porospora cf. gigantea A]|uniref:uncharacterized protein n=1 Tax=Porospora cf. gigantea A TaxID=2853593 RepID=UPI00355A7ED9|nr:MAG: hypothetical protein KVP18_002338 [Porospora cf. gigantea A]
MWFCCQWDEHADQLVEVTLSPRTRSPIEDIDGMPVCAVVVTPPYTHHEAEMPDEMIAPCEAASPAESHEMEVNADPGLVEPAVESVHSDEEVAVSDSTPLPAGEADRAPVPGTPLPAAEADRAPVPDSTSLPAAEADRAPIPDSTPLPAAEAGRAPVAAPQAPPTPVAKPSIAEKPVTAPKKAAAAHPPPKAVDIAKAMLAPQKKKPPTLRKGKIVVGVWRLLNPDHG